MKRILPGQLTAVLATKFLSVTQIRSAGLPCGLYQAPYNSSGIMLFQVARDRAASITPHFAARHYLLLTTVRVRRLAVPGTARWLT